MMRRLQLRATPDESLDAALLREVATLVPGALDQAVLDYRRLGDPGLDGTVPVLAVAARRDLVQGYTAALRAARLDPCLVDVDTFAIDRVRRAHDAAAGGEGDTGAVLLAHVGARSVALAVAQGGDAPVFVGDVPTAADSDPWSVARAMRSALELAGTEPAPARVLLSGGRALAPGFPEAVAACLGSTARVLDPFAGVTLGPRLRRTPVAGAAAFTVAVGLVIRGVEAAA
jgi:type IV pilus assembly protein PilM